MNYREILETMEPNWKTVENRIQSGIEDNRKSSVRVKFLHDGQPVSGAKVNFIQKTSDFGFALQIDQKRFKTDKNYKNDSIEAFNEFQVDFPWDSEKEHKEIEELLTEIKNAEKSVFGSVVYDDFSVPDNFPKNDIASAKKEIEKRISTLSGFFDQYVDNWLVSSGSLKYPGLTEFYKEEDYIKWLFSKSSCLLKDKKLTFGESTDVWADFKYTVGDYYPCNNGFNYCMATMRHNNSAFFIQLEKALLENVGFDEIAIDFDLSQEKFDTPEHCTLYFNPINMLNVLDDYSKLGRKIRITDFKLPKADENTEDMQSEVIKRMYKLFYSHSAVSSVVTAITDDSDLVLQVASGLYKSEYNTNDIRISDNSGQVSFRGFNGQYDLKIECGAIKKQFNITVDNISNNHFVFEI